MSEIVIAPRREQAEMARAQGQEPGPTMKDLGELPWHFVKTSRSSVVGDNPDPHRLEPVAAACSRFLPVIQ